MGKLRAVMDGGSGQLRPSRSMPTAGACRNARRWPEVSEQDLSEALRVAAELLIQDPVYLPIFERLEREKMLADRQNEAVDRARAITAIHSAIS